VAAEPDDLTKLFGIGPKSAEALNAAGITTYAALAAASEPAVREALYAGHVLPRSNMATWPMQASYAARGDWQGLTTYNESG
jgi:large subunit ribosomal protein L21